MDTCIHTCIHAYMHTYMHTCIHTHTYIHTNKHTYIHTYIHAQDPENQSVASVEAYDVDTCSWRQMSPMVCIYSSRQM